MENRLDRLLLRSIPCAPPLSFDHSGLLKNGAIPLYKEFLLDRFRILPLRPLNRENGVTASLGASASENADTAANNVVKKTRICGAQFQCGIGCLTGYDACHPYAVRKAHITAGLMHCCCREFEFHFDGHEIYCRCAPPVDCDEIDILEA